MRVDNRPAPLAALLDDVTATKEHYRRNHYPFPHIDPATWRLRVDGAVERPLELALADFDELTTRTAVVLLECAGHRRTEFVPPISGVQWSLGALSQARWGGVALAQVLAMAGVRDGAIEVIFHGADRGPFAELPGIHAFARSIPLAKALDPDTLLVTWMNDGPLPRAHGAPMRAVVPGWYAMDSVKWLTRIEVVTEPFRGAYQEHDYRFQAPGEDGIGTRIDEMPPHSLFVALGAGAIADGITVRAGSVRVSGIAWAGAGVAAVQVRVDLGEWVPVAVRGGAAYQRVIWTADLDLAPGQHTVAARAVDERGRTQPDAPIWNQRGYVNNSIQRFAVLAT
jgi:DMSO/TMAO reductase YedYZ molybdopterin-dependent catalytic subunit